jgi:hypothetical protein
MNRRIHVLMTASAKARRSFAARFLAGFVALVCLAAQFSSFAHLLLVHHSVCWEHGELIHDEPGASPAAVSSLPPAVQLHADHQRGPSVDAATLPRGAHEHEHCGALTERRNRVASCQPAESLAAPPAREVEAVARAAEVRGFSGIPLVLLAPKNSPPALA